MQNLLFQVGCKLFTTDPAATNQMQNTLYLITLIILIKILVKALVLVAFWHCFVMKLIEMPFAQAMEGVV